MWNMILFSITIHVSRLCDKLDGMSEETRLQKKHWLSLGSSRPSAEAVTCEAVIGVLAEAEQPRPGPDLAVVTARGLDGARPRARSADGTAAAPNGLGRVFDVEHVCRVILWSCLVPRY